MINSKSYRFWTLLLISSLAVTTTQCDKDDKKTKQELITRVVVHLTGTAGSTFDKEFEAIDSDGDGVFNSIDPIVIPAGTVFDCDLHVYDDTKNPVEDVTKEIEKDNKEHLFVFKSFNSGLTISNLNTDDDGAPFGLTSIWTTTSAGVGTVQVTLIHEPSDKNATDPGGETDFDVSFGVTIQ